MTTLRDDGLEFFRGAFADCVGTIAKFAADVESSLREPMRSGHINAIWKGDQVKKVALHAVEPEHGPTRLQSKSHPQPIPGSEAIWKRARELGVELPQRRLTLEWMSPAPLNANGWHIDTPGRMYKLVVMLDDVDMETCPMGFAFGGGAALDRVRARLRSNGYARTKEGYSGLHAIAQIGGHGGFLRDDEADNTGCVDETVVLGGEACRVAVCTGKVGDAYAFDVSMFHCSNSLKGKKVRRIAVLS
jgi:hypothetical protein